MPISPFNKAYTIQSSAENIDITDAGAYYTGTTIEAMGQEIGAQLGQIAIDVTLRGAIGDGLTDDTAAIQAVIDSIPVNGGSIYFPAGTYMIDATGTTAVKEYTDGGILVNKPLKIILHPSAILKAITGNQSGYSIVRILDTSYVEIVGGTIQGERTTHDGVVGEFGFGIYIQNSNHIFLNNLTVKDCWGDGIAIENFDCQYIYIDNCISTNNRRNALYLGGVKHVYIKNSEFSGSDGTAPKSGIDVEPAGSGVLCEDIIIDGCLFSDNDMQDIVLQGPNGIKNIRIINNTFNNPIIGVNIVGTTEIVAEELYVCENVMHACIIVGICCVLANNSVIKNNTINLANNGSSVGIIINKIQNTVVSENKIINGYYGITSSQSTVAENTKNIINGNIIKNVSFRFVDFYGTDCVVSNNIFDTSGDEGGTWRFVNSVIANNKISNATYPSVFSFNKCLVSGNEIVQGGEVLMKLTLAENSLIQNNYFHSTNNAVLAIQELNVPTIPSVVINNVARYGTGLFSLQGTTIQATNYTL